MDTKYKLPDLHNLVKAYSKIRNMSLSRLSKKMGKAPNYLTQKLKNPNPDILLLLELSELLKYNFVEQYILLLPIIPQTTHREKGLYAEMEKYRKEIYELRNELEKVKAERDKYWEAISVKR